MGTDLEFFILHSICLNKVNQEELIIHITKRTSNSIQSLFLVSMRNIKFYWGVDLVPTRQSAEHVTRISGKLSDSDTSRQLL